MAIAYSTHRTSYVWLTSSHGVYGFELDELNHYIDSYNESNAKYFINFWEWMYAVHGFDVHAFDCLWNEGNPLMSKVHHIKSKLNGGISYGL